MIPKWLLVLSCLFLSLLAQAQEAAPIVQAKVKQSPQAAYKPPAWSVEAFYSHSNFNGGVALFNAWRLQSSYQRGVMAAFYYKRLAWYLGVADLTLSANYDESRALILFSKMRSRGNLEIHYIQAPTGFKFSFLTLEQVQFYTRALFSPSWKTSQSGEGERYETTLFGPRSEVWKPSEAPRTSNFMIMGRAGVGVTVTPWQGLALGLEAAVERMVYTDSEWQRGGTPDDVASSWLMSGGWVF